MMEMHDYRIWDFEGEKRLETIRWCMSYEHAAWRRMYGFYWTDIDRGKVAITKITDHGYANGIGRMYEIVVRDIKGPLDKRRVRRPRFMIERIGRSA